jgi:hypothetical protein
VPAAEAKPAAPATESKPAERDRSIGQPQTEAPRDGTPSGEAPLRQDVPPASSAPAPADEAKPAEAAADASPAEDEAGADDKPTGQAGSDPKKPSS